MNKSPREVLLDYAMRSGGWNDKSAEEVGQALHDLAEMVKREKKENEASTTANGYASYLLVEHSVFRLTEKGAFVFNAAIDHIAKLFEQSVQDGKENE